MSGPAFILACATCYGAADSPMTDGQNMAILTLLGVTFVVLAGLAATMVYFVRRANRYQIAQEILDNNPHSLPQIN